MRSSLPRWLAGLSLVALFLAFSGQSSAQYCTPPYTNNICTAFGPPINNSIVLGRVQFANLDNSAPCTNNQGPGFSFFSALTARVEAGASYNLRVEPGAGYNDVNSGDFLHSYTGWIDYNRNNVFEASEQIINFVAPVTAFPNWFNARIANVNVTVPLTATPGLTRMRIRVANATNVGPCDATGFGEAHDYPVEISFPGIVNSFPSASGPGSVLLAGQIFDGNTNPRPSLTISRVTLAGISQRITQWRIVAVSAQGFLPGQQVWQSFNPVNLTPIFDALPTPPPNPVTLNSTKAQGVATVQLPLADPGNDGSFRTTTVPGGQYRVEATMEFVSGTTVIATQNYTAEFSVSVQRDISTVAIASPLIARRQSYFQNEPIPMRASFRNTGIEPIARYRARWEVRNAVTNVIVDQGSVIRSNQPGGGLPAGGLLTGAEDNADFFSMGNFRTPLTDSFRLIVCADLLATTLLDPQNDQNPNLDQQPFNDCFPRSNQPNHIFRTWPLIDFEARAIVQPTTASQLFTGRPVRTEVQFANNGRSEEPFFAQLTVTHVPTNTVIVNNEQIIVEVPSQIGFNIANRFFSNWTPVLPGAYQICARVQAPGDAVASNDQVCVTVNVLPRLCGDVRVGTGQTFATVQAAVDALYRQGIDCAVRFILTDPVYNVGPSGVNGPALDLTSNIVGVSSTNTITFAVDPLNVGLRKAGVTINLNSPNGIGILFGQSSTPRNPNAIYNEFPNAANANSPGNITFDGGPQKSLRLRLNTAAKRRAVVYLGTRTFNTTIRNCVIEMDPSTPELEYNTSIPRVRIDGTDFVFENDSVGVGTAFRTFSAGIVQRNRPPVGEFGSNLLRLDTMIIEGTTTFRGNKGNRFLDNEIRGFGIGIMTLGIGTINQANNLTRFYNVGTEIRGNDISRVRRAAIFLGYEDGAIVSNNKIYNVGTPAILNPGPFASYGIIAGSEPDTRGGCSACQGYNNLNIEISRNEINNVISDVIAGGILVNQSQNNYTVIIPGQPGTFQPSVPERMKVMSNMIWGIRAQTPVFSQGLVRTGIIVTTDRSTTSFLQPRLPRYFSREDSIVNNTIVLDDAAASAQFGINGAVIIQNALNAVVMNNAIANLTPLTTAGFLNAGLVYQGIHPKYQGNVPSCNVEPGRLQSGGLISDFNAFWVPNASVARFGEIDTASNVLVLGYQDEYQTLDQWRSWTGQDVNSFVGNFVAEHELTPNSTFPLEFLRVRPNITGSVLNNRGLRINGVVGDVDNQPRGSAGVPFDIGADEFAGVPFINDVEVTTILAPRAYRSGTSVVNFADAEYITSTDSVQVFARIRNNSSVSQSVTVTGTVTMESAASSSQNSVPTGGFALNQTLTPGTRFTVIPGGATQDIDLGWFRANSLLQLGSTYSTPSFMRSAVDSSMRAHVSPRYSINARITTLDENMNNNASSSVARFYIRRSPIGMLVSWEGRGTVLNNSALAQSNPTAFARSVIGRLNSDSLKRGLDSLGFTSGLNNTVTGITYDILDRDGWEPRNFDFKPYRTMIWSQDNNVMSRDEREALRDFVAVARFGQKKNLIMSSQEITPRQIGMDVVNDESFVRYQLRSRVGRTTGTAPQNLLTPVSTGYGAPALVPAQAQIEGMTVARNLREQISATGFAICSTGVCPPSSTTGLIWTDPTPRPSLMRVHTDMFAAGLARPAYRFVTRDANAADSAAGVASAGSCVNVLHLGIDWRHFGQLTGQQRTGVVRVLRSGFDYFDFNGGSVIPVELVAFDANAVGNNVAVNWSTASEQNSGWFDVERAQVTPAGVGSFERIASRTAAGNSSVRRDYDVVDKGLAPGQYSYRLRMVDLDGTSEYSGTVEVEVGSSATALSVTNPVPNPTNGESALEVSIDQASNVQAVLVDVTGAEVMTLIDAVRSAGNFSVVVPTEGLSSGMYRVVIRANGATETRMLQVTR